MSAENVVEITEGRPTPETVLTQALAESDDFDTIVLVTKSRIDGTERLEIRSNTRDMEKILGIMQRVAVQWALDA